MVPRVGVEPTRLASVDFESTASANSATWAFKRPRNLENPFARVHVNFTGWILNTIAQSASSPVLVTRSF